MLSTHTNELELRHKLQLLRFNLYEHLYDCFRRNEMDEEKEKVLSHLMECMSKQSCMNCHDPKNQCLIYPCLELNDLNAIVTWFSSSK